ncbi:quinone oxidoreductase [Klebsiella pneumoniae]|nr:quinone oxidoreductase [Klebsiella pneumoniae]
MKALVLDQIDNRTVATVKDIDLPALAEGDVLRDPLIISPKRNHV